MIIVDTRENGNFDEFEKKMLEVGDFHFFKEGSSVPSLIVERKIVKDYVASIKDGRLHEQCFRLREISSGVRIAYIIEGNLNETGSESITPDTIKNSTINKVVHFGIPVFYTASLEGTKALLLRLDKSVQDYEPSERSTYLSCTKTKKSTEENSFERILMTIPGISSSGADAIKDKFETLPKLMKALECDHSCLIGLKIGSKGIGEKTAKKIRLFLGL